MKNSRYVTVCKESQGKILTREIPVQSWRMVAGKMGANGWKECVPTAKAIVDFPELNQAKETEVVKEKEPVAEKTEPIGNVPNDEPKQEGEKHIVTRQYLEGLKQPELVKMAGIGLKKKSELINKILEDQN